MRRRRPCGCREYHEARDVDPAAGAGWDRHLLPPAARGPAAVDRSARAVANAIPAARVVTIDGPHLALYTNAAAAADVIVDFMRQGTPGRRFDAASPGA